MASGSNTIVLKYSHGEPPTQAEYLSQTGAALLIRDQGQLSLPFFAKSVDEYGITRYRSNNAIFIYNAKNRSLSFPLIPAYARPRLFGKDILLELEAFHEY